MPYIKQEDRTQYNPILEEIWNNCPQDDRSISYLLRYVHYLAFADPVDSKPNQELNERVIQLKNLMHNLPEAQFVGHLNYCISYIYFRILQNATYASHCAHKMALLSTYKQKLDSNVEFEFKAVLLDVIMEGYRRFTAPYEDKKIAENGDIL